MILYTSDDGRTTELYNLRQGIEQRSKLAREHPEKAQQLQNLIERIKKQDTL